MQVPPKEKGSGVEKAGGVLQNVQMQRFAYVQNDILRKNLQPICKTLQSRANRLTGGNCRDITKAQQSKRLHKEMQNPSARGEMQSRVHTNENPFTELDFKGDIYHG